MVDSWVNTSKQCLGIQVREIGQIFTKLGLLKFRKVLYNCWSINLVWCYLDISISLLINWIFFYVDCEIIIG